MHLVPREVVLPAPIVCRLDSRTFQHDKLIISQTGLLAQRRLARGVKLNHAEATVR